MKNTETHTGDQKLASHVRSWEASLLSKVSGLARLTATVGQAVSHSQLRQYNKTGSFLADTNYGLVYLNDAVKELKDIKLIELGLGLGRDVDNIKITVLLPILWIKWHKTYVRRRNAGC